MQNVSLRVFNVEDCYSWSPCRMLVPESRNIGNQRIIRKSKSFDSSDEFEKRCINNL
jgi:hypothetical protein